MNVGLVFTRQLIVSSYTSEVGITFLGIEESRLKPHNRLVSNEFTKYRDLTGLRDRDSSLLKRPKNKTHSQLKISKGRKTVMEIVRELMYVCTFTDRN